MEKTGIRFETPGFREGIKNLEDIQSKLKQFRSELKKTDIKEVIPSSAIENVKKGFQGLIKDSSSLKDAFSKLPSFAKSLDFKSLTGEIFKFDAVLGKLPASAKGVMQMFGGLSGAMGSFSSGLIAGAAAIGIAVASFVAARIALKAIFSEAARAAAITTTMEAFGNALGSLGNSTRALQNLRRDTRNTISDMELMRLSIAALQGTSDEFRQVVGPNLGKVFDVTSRAARASGQNVEVVREKFIFGLRRQSKLLLDDIGVNVDAAKANQRYAESLGLTATALTENQKRAAFAAEAIRQLDAISEETGGITTLAEAAAQISTVFQNLRDRLSLSLAPMLEPILGIISEIVQGFGALAEYVFPIIEFFAVLIGETLTFAWMAFKAVIYAVFGPLIDLAITVLPYVGAAFMIMSDLVKSAFDSIKQSVQIFSGISNKIREFLGITSQDIEAFVGNAALGLAYGGGLIIGAFAGGIMKASTKVIEAVTFIAKIVADFLQGLSPPKLGPLSKIDEGGKRVIEAWADGFIKANLTPVDRVAQFVNDKLGAIGQFNIKQVEDRLGMLDLAIRPFKESLEIVKSEMEAIAGFVDPALKAIDNQRKRLLKTVLTGSQEDLKTLQLLDKQAEQLKEIKAFESDRVNEAEIQLALASALQAEERALLNIQKNRLGLAQQTTDQMKEAGGAAGKMDKEPGIGKEPKEPKGSGAGAADDDGLGGGIPKGKPPELNARMAQIKDALQSAARAGMQAGFGDAGVEFAASNAALQQQLGRIREADPVSKITEKFSNLSTDVMAPLNAFKTAVETFFSGLIGEDGTVLALFDSFKARFDVKINEITTDATTKFSEFTTGVRTTFRTVFGTEGSLMLNVNSFKSSFDTAMTGLIGEGGTILTSMLSFKTTFEDTLNGLFGAEGILNTLFGDGSLFVTIFGGEGTLVTAFAGLATSVINALGAESEIAELLGENGTLRQLFSSLVTTAVTKLGIVASVFGFVFSGENSLLSRAKQSVQTNVDQIKSIFSTIPSDIITNLAALPGALRDNLIKPIFDALRNVAFAVESLLLGLIGQINNAIRATPFLKDEWQIHLEPGFLTGTIPEFQKGGIVNANLHRGEGVLSVPMMRTLASLERILAAPNPMSIISGMNNSTTTNNNTTNNNINISTDSVRDAILLQKAQMSFLGL